MRVGLGVRVRRVGVAYRNPGPNQGDGANYESLGGEGAKYSITLNGTVRVETGELAEKYRRIHLARNAKYKQFIVGPDIAIITVHLTRARICDVNDQVTHFSKSGSSWVPADKGS